MAQPIQHLVVLMLENRSFDHMLGFMRSPSYPINGCRVKLLTMAPGPVLSIFISSSPLDLRNARERARDAISRLENLPIAMETFFAQSGEPLRKCTRMAAQSHAVIRIVGPRGAGKKRHLFRD